MPYCMYLRKSRTDIEADKNNELETLERHKQILSDYAVQNNLVISKIYMEVVSGETISSRPVMQQLLNDVECGLWEGVLVVEVERLARGDTIDQGLVSQAFKYSNTKIITPIKVYNPNNEFDEEYFEFGLFMSRREYKIINRRLQRGRIQSVKEGKYVGNVAPYGYNRKKLEKEKGFTLEINSEEAEIVKLIFQLYTGMERMGVAKIAKKINNMNVLPRKGNIWSAATISEILKNPVYIGKIRWNNRAAVKVVEGGKITKKRPRAAAENIMITEGLHKAIIDKETWDLTQSYLSKRAVLHNPSKVAVKNPLAGLIVCSKCGHKMIRRAYKADSYKSVLMCITFGCDNVSSSLGIVEEKILEVLEKCFNKYLITVESGKKNTDNIESRQNRQVLKKIDLELSSLKKQMNIVYDMFEQGIYTISVFSERLNLINEKIRLLEENKADVMEKLDRNSINSIIESSHFFPKMKKLLEVYNDTLEPLKKNQLLKEVIEKIVYTKNVNCRWNNSADNFEIVIYPKLPVKCDFEIK